MTRCYLGVGGNLGNVAAAIDRATASLAETPRIALRTVSALVRTKPIGGAAGGEYLNAAIELDTSLEPLALLDRLQALERAAGRVPSGHWMPRPLDLDLLLYGDEIIDIPRLKVPHPACWYRRFVLDPLVTIAPNALHPERGATVGVLHERLLARPLKLALAGGTHATRTQISEAADQSDDVAIDHWGAEGAGPVIVAWLGQGDGIPDVYESLPRISRLDLSHETDQVSFLRDVLRAALG